MDLQEKTKTFGSILLFLAVLARLFSSAEFLRDYLQKPENTAFLIYLETGIDTRSSFSPEDAPAEEATAPPTVASTEPPAETSAPTKPPKALRADDLEIYYGAKVSPDLQALLEAPVSLTLQKGLPAVLIYSTHSTESYTPEAEPYTPSADYRTKDKTCNMLSVGAELQALLQAQGLCALRDDEIHDAPSYNYAYSHARKSATAYLKENPSVCLVLDLHRDAVQTKTGQLRPLAPDCATPTAQIMLVVGTNASGLQHDNWERNLSLALKLHTILEEISPGITRPLSIRAQRFNQDLHDGALLVEIGAAGNSRAEALAAVKILSQAIGELFRRYGTQ